MAGANVLEFTDATFQAEVLSSTQPVLVDFWAEWCGPCRALTPTIEKLAAEFAGKARVGKVDTDKNQDVSVKYQVTAIPTILIFKGGQVAKKFVGLRSENDLREALNDALK
jgi:thioredoxin 1